MLLRLMAILFTAIGALAVAIIIGIGLLLMLRFWWVAVIVVIFWGLMYTVAELAGLSIKVEQKERPYAPEETY